MNSKTKCVAMSGQPALRVIVSGGQAGADRAALDVALERGLQVGGWVPMGRLAEDGPISERYTGLERLLCRCAKIVRELGYRSILIPSS